MTTEDDYPPGTLAAEAQRLENAGRELLAAVRREFELLMGRFCRK